MSRSTLKRWILTGHIKTVKTQGGHHRIPSSEIERLSGITSTSFDDDSASVISERPHVLVVDDAKDTRDFLELWLTRHCGYDVTIATDATEALERARERPVDAYVLDNVLPNISGIDLCRRIREKDATTPIIFYSFLKDEEKEAVRVQAQAYVQKPDLDALLQTLDFYVKRRQVK